MPGVLRPGMVVRIHGGTPSVAGFLLLESGDHTLLESSDDLLKEGA